MTMYMDSTTRACYNSKLVYSSLKPHNGECTGDVCYMIDSRFEDGIDLRWVSRGKGQAWICDPPPLCKDYKPSCNASEVVNAYCLQKMTCSDPSFKCGPQNAKSEKEYCWDYYEGWSSNLPSDAPEGANVQRHRGMDLMLWPKGATCDTPRILFIHGGGGKFFGPSNCGYNNHGSKIAARAQAIVMLIDYPLVPIGNYASIFDWSLKAWNWLGEHGPHAMDCPPEKRPAMFLAGDSFGGNVAFSLLLTLYNKPDQGPVAMGYIGESAWLDFNGSSTTFYSQAFSESEINDTLHLSGDVMFTDSPSKNIKNGQDFGHAYCDKTCGANGDDLNDPYVSPYWATLSMLAGLPPLYFVTSSTEVLSGDSMHLAHQAARVGVHVYLDQFEGMWHTFPQWSEGGCAGKGAAPLWQGELALQRMGQFVQQVALQSAICPSEYKGSGLAGEPETLFRSLSATGDKRQTPLVLSLCSAALAPVSTPPTSIQPSDTIATGPRSMINKFTSVSSNNDEFKESSNSVVGIVCMMLAAACGIMVGWLMVSAHGTNLTSHSPLVPMHDVELSQSGRVE